MHYENVKTATNTHEPADPLAGTPSRPPFSLPTQTTPRCPRRQVACVACAVRATLHAAQTLASPDNTPNGTHPTRQAQTRMVDRHTPDTQHTPLTPIRQKHPRTGRSEQPPSGTSPLRGRTGGSGATCVP